MAMNPMQKKSRISFILGMLIMLVIAGIVVALLYMKIQNQQKTIDQYKVSVSKVYVLNSDVKSGQVLSQDMFKLTEVPKSSIPANATTDIATTLGSYSLSTDSGLAIYTKRGYCINIKEKEYILYQYKDGKEQIVETLQAGDKAYYKGNTGNVNITVTEKSNSLYTESEVAINKRDVYFVMANGKEREIYRYGAEGNEEVAISLMSEDRAFYKDDNNRNIDITVASNSVIAKVDMNANTIITGSLIARADEKISDDLRIMEYNVLTLPIDLITGDYVDIRLQLPNGQDYIVTSKKQVKVPVVNGMYLSDTIQMNLTEKEILYMSCAIVENFQMQGSKLYAVKYKEAGMQEKAALTYTPSEAVKNEINDNPNILDKAINGLENRRADIERQINQNSYGDSDGISSGIDNSTAATLEARKSYLETLVPTN